MPKVELVPNGEIEFTDVKVEKNRMVGEPVFYGTGRENANILTILVKNPEGETVRRYLLRVCGADGKVTVQERSQPVVAAMENPKAKKSKPAAASAEASPAKGGGSPTPV